MSANVIPQALPLISGSHMQCPLKKKLGLSHAFGFLSLLSSTPSTRRSVSFASSDFLGQFAAKLSSRPSFLVRADSVSEGESEAAEDVVQDGEEEAQDGFEGDADFQVEDQSPKEPKPLRKPRVKLGDIMGILNKRAVEASNQERHTPDLRTGDIVEIKLEVPENRRRLSVYKGIVMSKQNAGIHTTIRVRRIIAGCGVEIVFPVYSPNIKEIKVVKHRKVRRARLYYLRDKLPRLSTFN